MLWPGSPAAFRARWNAVCWYLEVPCTEFTGVTPASLRGGGASALYEVTEDAELVRRRGRGHQLRSAEIYIQEVGGHEFLAHLPERVRNRVLDLHSIAGALLLDAVGYLQAGAASSDLPALLRRVRA